MPSSCTRAVHRQSGARSIWMRLRRSSMTAKACSYTRHKTLKFPGTLSPVTKNMGPEKRVPYFFGRFQPRRQEYRRIWRRTSGILHSAQAGAGERPAESFPSYEAGTDFHAELLRHQFGLIFPGKGHHLADQPLIVACQGGITEPGGVLCHHSLLPGGVPGWGARLPSSPP